MKVRVLYPMAFANRDDPPVAGDVITIPDDEGKQLVAAGYAEPADAKPPKTERPVERAVATPGTKRGPGRPRKTPPPEPKGADG